MSSLLNENIKINSSTVPSGRKQTWIRYLYFEKEQDRILKFSQLSEGKVDKGAFESTLFKDFLGKIELLCLRVL